MAEIELILSITVLITILMLLQGAMRLGAARLGTSQDAQFKAFNNATAGPSPQYIDDPAAPLVDGLAALRPGLPNRIHSPRPAQSVAVSTGTSGNLSVNIQGTSAVPGPFWIYSAYPVPADQAPTEQWFLDYAAESHTAYSSSMGLAPAWPP